MISPHKIAASQRAETTSHFDMSKPYIHALSSAKRYGGTPDDYMDIHILMDSSKAAVADNRHRFLTHNAWFIGHILEKIFGSTRINSDDKVYSVRDIGEQHVLEDFGGKFIPTAQDYVESMEFAMWMQNGRGIPPSHKKVAALSKNKTNPKLISFD